MKMFEFRLKFHWSLFPKVQLIPALVQIMAWRRSGDKPLSEPMMISLLTHICVTRPQWVNRMRHGAFLMCFSGCSIFQTTFDLFCVVNSYGWMWIAIYSYTQSNTVNHWLGANLESSLMGSMLLSMAGIELQCTRLWIKHTTCPFLWE